MKLRLKYWRKKRGMTLEHVGERLGVSHAAVSRWEAGSRRPTIENLVNLAQVYRVAPGALFENTDADPVIEAGDIALSLPTDQAAAWLAMGRTLQPK